MKTLHYSIIIVLITFAMTSSNVFAQTSPAPNDLGDGNLFNMKAKDRGLPSDIVEINGNLVTKDPIKIILNDPNGIIRNSVTTFADRNGDFTSELKIPSDATAGTWKIIGNSETYHRELNFTVIGNSATETCYGLNCIDLNSTGITSTPPLIHGVNPPSVLSPLKQFKSGIHAKDVQCTQSLELVIKVRDSSPACVKPDTASILVKRGWAEEIVTQKSQNTTLPDPFMQCDTPYHKSDMGVAVLYMPTNSIGKICVRYSNGNDTPVPIDILRIFNAEDNNQNTTNITIWNDWYYTTISKGNFTAEYWIKTGNQTGFYELSVPSCTGTPFAVGYNNNSRITASDFPWIGTSSCAIIAYGSDIDSTAGIGVKYIPYP